MKDEGSPVYPQGYPRTRKNSTQAVGPCQEKGRPPVGHRQPLPACCHFRLNPPSAQCTRHVAESFTSSTDRHGRFSVSLLPLNH